MQLRSVADAIRKPFQKHFINWLDRRIPAAKTVELNRKRIFIAPTKQGYLYCLLLFILLLGAINYENSLGFAFLFLLVSIFVNGIFHTYRNLSGLSFSSMPIKSVFVGEHAVVNLQVNKVFDHAYEAIHLSWGEHLKGRQSADEVELIEVASKQARLFYLASNRGYQQLPRLYIATTYPLGLLRAWTWLDLDIQLLAYPRPIESELLSAASSEHNEGALLAAEGVDDYSGLRNYVAGDSLKHIAWKASARYEQLYTKQFNDYVSEQLWVDWDSYPGMDVEQRLSRLCYWVVTLSMQQKEFGLRLTDKTIPPGSSDKHRNRCLVALALYSTINE